MQFLRSNRRGLKPCFFGPARAKVDAILRTRARGRFLYAFLRSSRAFFSFPPTRAKAYAVLRAFVYFWGVPAPLCMHIYGLRPTFRKTFFSGHFSLVGFFGGLRRLFAGLFACSFTRDRPPGVFFRCVFTVFFATPLRRTSRFTRDRPPGGRDPCGFTVRSTPPPHRTSCFTRDRPQGGARQKRLAGHFGR